MKHYMKHQMEKRKLKDYQDEDNTIHFQPYQFPVASTEKGPVRSNVLCPAILRQYYVPQYYITTMLCLAVLHYDDVTLCSIKLRRCCTL